MVVGSPHAPGRSGRASVHRTAGRSGKDRAACRCSAGPASTARRRGHPDNRTGRDHSRHQPGRGRAPVPRYAGAAPRSPAGGRAGCRAPRGGGTPVSEAIAEGAIISSANLAEVLTKRADAGDHPAAVAASLVETGLLGGALAVVDLNFDDAVEIAKLRGSIRSVGLSLGDRACLALARRYGARVLTADAAWARLDIGVRVQTIR